MPTTTIRIEDELKARLAAAAERAGMTTHAFILDALAQTADQAELDQEFNQLADRRWKKLLADGETVAWVEARAWLEARAHGERSRKPRPRKLSR